MSDLLYKFGSAESALSILQSNTLWATDPMDFNDPFEILPAFDDERKKVAVTSRDRFGEITNSGELGSISQLVGEDFPGFGGLNEECHGHFFPYVSERYRVISFNENPENILMWSHYGCSHRGIVIGFDVSKGRFPTGLIPKGLQVDYVKNREKLKLPVHAYYFGLLRKWESGDLPDGLVRHNGFVVPPEVLEQQYEDAIIQILHHKHEAWKYEAELRFVYDLHDFNRSGLRREKTTAKQKPVLEKDVAHFTDEAVQEIKLGCYCPPEEAEALFTMLSKGRYPHARLYMTELHAHEFKVVFRELDKNQMHNCYVSAIPGTWRGRPRV